MALKCECGGEIRKTIDNKVECIICGIAKKGDDKMAKEHDFKIEKISGTATVIDGNRVYDIYVTFAKAAGYLEAVNHGKRLTDGDKVVIKAFGNHEYESFGKIYVVESGEGVKYLVGEKGLTDIQLDEPTQIPEQTYAEIAEPFGKQFRDAIREAYARGYADGNKREKLDVKMDGKRIGEMMREETPQEKRDRIVKQAKADVENNFIEGNHGVGKVVDTKFGHCTVEFVVNREKRTVVALLRGAYAKEIFGKGIAKCVPGDCFNIHIGKIVGLRKALGKSIDDYMNVPNPTEVRVGDIIRWIHKFSYVIEGKDGNILDLKCKENGESFVGFEANLNACKIIDDSREEVSE